MSKSIHTVLSFDDRKHLSSIIMDPQRVPAGTRVHFTGAKRTLGQNTRLWGTATTLSEKARWHGQELSPRDWINLAIGSLKSARIVPNLDGDGFVVLGVSSSDLSREEADNVQEQIYELGARFRVTFNEPRDPPGLAPPAPSYERQNNQRTSSPGPLAQPREAGPPLASDKAGEGYDSDRKGVPVRSRPRPGEGDHVTIENDESEFERPEF